MLTIPAFLLPLYHNRGLVAFVCLPPRMFQVLLKPIKVHDENKCEPRCTLMVSKRKSWYPKRKLKIHFRDDLIPKLNQKNIDIGSCKL